MSSSYYVPFPFILRGKVYFYRSPKMKALEWLGIFALNFPVLKKLFRKYFAKLKFEIISIFEWCSMVTHDSKILLCFFNFFLSLFFFVWFYIGFKFSVCHCLNLLFFKKKLTKKKNLF